MDRTKNVFRFFPRRRKLSERETNALAADNYHLLISFIMAANSIDNKKWITPISARLKLLCFVSVPITGFPPLRQRILRKSRKRSPKFQASRSPISLFAPSRTYVKKDKRQDRERGFVESCTRSNAKTVIVSKFVRHHVPQNLIINKTYCLCQVLALRTPFRDGIFLAIIEWGWVGYEEFCRSRRVLSTEAEGRGG